MLAEKLADALKVIHPSKIYSQNHLTHKTAVQRWRWTQNYERGQSERGLAGCRTLQKIRYITLGHQTTRPAHREAAVSKPCDGDGPGNKERHPVGGEEPEKPVTSLLSILRRICTQHIGGR